MHATQPWYLLFLFTLFSYSQVHAPLILELRNQMLEKDAFSNIRRRCHETVHGASQECFVFIPYYVQNMVTHEFSRSKIQEFNQRCILLFDAQYNIIRVESAEPRHLMKIPHMRNNTGGEGH